MSTPAQVWQYRTLVGNLAGRDLKARYKKSVIGWGWSLINPAVTLGIYTVVFGVFLNGRAPALGNGDEGTFGLWLFAGLVMWNAFAGGINSSIASFLGAGPLLTRTYFPPECPLVAGASTVLIQTTLEVGILLGVMTVFGNVGWTFLFVVPIVALMTLFAMGLGMLLSLLNVRYRDVNYLVAVGMQVLFYATPIVYRADQIPDKVGPVPTDLVLSLNPVTHFVDAMRKATYQLRVPTLGNWVGMGVSTAVAITIGWWFFSRRAPRYIEEI